MESSTRETCSAFTALPEMDVAGLPHTRLRIT